jgi:RNase P subunit RPR2
MAREELSAMDVIANVLQIKLQRKERVLLCMACGSRTNIDDQRQLQEAGGSESLRYCDACAWDLPVPEHLIGRVLEDGND